MLSDHGQTQGATFKQRNGYGLDDLVERSLSRGAVDDFMGGDEQSAMAGHAVAEATGRSGDEKRAKNDVSDRDVVVLGSGNLGLVYLMEEPRRLTLEEIEERHPKLIPALREHPHVGWLLVRSEQHGAVVLGGSRRAVPRRGPGRGEDPLAPFSPTAAAHLPAPTGSRTSRTSWSGSFYDPVLDEGCAFEELISFHGGLGGLQTRPFILHPAGLPLSASRSSARRPCTGSSRAGAGCCRRRAGAGAAVQEARSELSPASPWARANQVEARGTSRRGRAAGAARVGGRCLRPPARPVAGNRSAGVPHELTDRGAALTYYSVLALIPALLVLFSVIGLFGNQGTIESVLGIVKEVGPSNGEAVGRDPLTEVVQHDTRSGFLLGTSLIAIIWTASAYVGSFFRASATIWGVERRPAWRAWPLRMALTVGILILISMALLLITLTGQLAKSIGDEVGIGDAVLDVYGIAKWPALLMVVTFAVGLLYRASPSGERTHRVAHPDPRRRGGGGDMDGGVRRLRGLRQRVCQLRQHLRCAGHHDRGPDLAVAHEPHAADGSGARRGARAARHLSRRAPRPKRNGGLRRICAGGILAHRDGVRETFP